MTASETFEIARVVGTDKTPNSIHKEQAVAAARNKAASCVHWFVSNKGFLLKQCLLQKSLANWLVYNPTSHKSRAAAAAAVQKVASQG